jgi:hypothetical protein
VLVAFIVFALASVLTGVFFVVWLAQAELFAESGWDVFLPLAGISAIVAVGTGVVIVVLGFLAMLRPPKDNDPNGGGSNL